MILSKAGSCEIDLHRQPSMDHPTRLHHHLDRHLLVSAHEHDGRPDVSGRRHDLHLRHRLLLGGLSRVALAGVPARHLDIVRD